MGDNVNIGDIEGLNELLVPNMKQLELIPTLFAFGICVIMSFIVEISM